MSFKIMTAIIQRKTIYKYKAKQNKKNALSLMTVETPVATSLYWIYTERYKGALEIQQILIFQGLLFEEHTMSMQIRYH